MEGWIVLILAVLLIAFFAARYVSTQLGDKERNIKYVQNITPGSTQNSMPPPSNPEEDARGKRLERAQDREFVLRRTSRPEDRDGGSQKGKPKSARIFRDKGDFRRAMLIEQIFKRKT